MEILSDKNKKRTLLVITDSDEQFSCISHRLSQDYRLERCSDENTAFQTIKEHCDSISAVLVCAGVLCADDKKLLTQVTDDAKLVTLPLIMLVDDVISESDSDLMDCGVIDIISLRYGRRMMKHIIENSIRIKDSATFYEIEKMLRELPSLIYLKDAEGKYVFSTHYWHHLKQDGDPDWNIRGKTDIEIRKDKENAIKAQQSDMELLRTGKGTAYTIEVNADGIQDFLEIIKRPVRDEKGNITGIIALINNVTDKELLKRQLEEKTRKDKLTGLYSRTFFEEYVQRLSNSSEYPITFISADCNGLKMINDTYGHIVGDEYLRMAALLFKMVIGKNGSVFRMGGDEFVIVLPKTDEQQAKEYIDRLLAEEKLYTLKENKLSVSYGCAGIVNDGTFGDGDAVRKRILEAIELADSRMYEYKRAMKNRNK